MASAGDFYPYEPDDGWEVPFGVGTVVRWALGVSVVIFLAEPIGAYLWDFLKYVVPVHPTR